MSELTIQNCVARGTCATTTALWYSRTSGVGGVRGSRPFCCRLTLPGEALLESAASSCFAASLLQHVLVIGTMLYLITAWQAGHCILRLRSSAAGQESSACRVLLAQLSQITVSQDNGACAGSRNRVEKHNEWRLTCALCCCRGSLQGSADPPLRPRAARPTRPQLLPPRQPPLPASRLRRCCRARSPAIAACTARAGDAEARHRQPAHRRTLFAVIASRRALKLAKGHDIPVS